VNAAGTALFFENGNLQVRIMNLASAAARFAAAEADLEAARAPMLAAACMMVAEKSRGLIEHPNDHWAPLKPETLKRKDGVNTPPLGSGKKGNGVSPMPDH
jgi:hypothetical protein